MICTGKSTQRLCEDGNVAPFNDSALDFDVTNFEADEENNDHGGEAQQGIQQENFDHRNVAEQLAASPRGCGQCVIIFIGVRCCVSMPCYAW